MARHTIFLPDPLTTAAERRAKTEGRSFSGYITRLIDRDVSKNEPKPAEEIAAAIDELGATKALAVLQRAARR